MTLGEARSQATAPATFVKRDLNAPAGFFEAEARGLRWLAEVPDGVPVVGVRDVRPGQVVLDRLDPTRPTVRDAEAFGARLARTHGAGSSTWGRTDGDGFIGPLPLPNGPYSTWAELYWCGRVEPYLRLAVDGGLLERSEVRVAETTVATATEDVPAPSPSRIHGDLWSGNVVWASQGATLIDGGAAHGGHHETDLAMLALFGLPHLDRVRSAYNETRPLDDGWTERVALMQLHPLLVHAVLFGGGYVGQVRRTLARLG